MDRSSKSTVVAVAAMIAVFVGVIGTVAWVSLHGDNRSVRTSISLVDEEKRRADEAIRKAQDARAQIEKLEHESAAKAEAERQAADQKRKKEEANLSAARKKEQDAEAQRNDAAARAREAVAREKRRRGLLANRSIPTARFNPWMCAEKSAAAFESSFFADGPDAKAAVHFFDISTADGSLIVHLTREIVESSGEKRKEATDAVVRAWRESKYTRSHGFSSTVEFRYGDSVLFTEKE